MKDICKLALATVVFTVVCFVIALPFAFALRAIVKTFFIEL